MDSGVTAVEVALEAPLGEDLVEALSEATEGVHLAATAEVHSVATEVVHSGAATEVAHSVEIT